MYPGLTIFRGKKVRKKKSKISIHHQLTKRTAVTFLIIKFNMTDSSINFWVNPFQMLRFNGKDEQFTKGAEVGVDDERENGDNPIRTHSPRSQIPGSYKKSSPPTSTPTRTRRHSFISSDEKPPKGMNFTMPTKVVTPADAAAVLAASLNTPPYNNSTYINHDKKLNYQHHPHKYSVDEKQSKKQLKRSISFNHSNRSTSPRQTASIDVAEVLATTVSFVRENNKKLDRLSDEVRSDGQSSDNDMDSVMSDDSMESWQFSSNNREIENEIAVLGIQLNDMEQKYKEQIRGKNRLIEELESAWKKSEKDVRKKDAKIERLENQVEASRRAIAELVEQQQQRESEGYNSRVISPDPEQAETLRLLEQELEEKDKIIEELNNKIQISNNKKTVELKEKDKKLETISNQLLKYQSLESEWQNKQTTIDSLTSQLEILKKREVELNEKDALIETLNIRLDTSQKVISELREKHAPHDLLRQLRQKDYIIDNLTQQVENIDAEMKDKDDNISVLKSQLADEKKVVDKLKEQTAQIEPLKKKIEEVEDTNYEIRNKLAYKERQLAESEKRYKEALTDSQDSQDKIKAQEQNMSTLRQEITQLRQTLSAQASESREKERLLNTLRDETARMRSNFQGLINALSEKDQKIQQFERHLESLQNAPKSNPSENENKVTKNEVRLNALQKVLNNKIEACREYEKKIVNLEKEFDGFKKQIEETQSDSSEKEVKIARLVKMNRQLKEEVTELKQKMEEKEKELVLIKSKIPKPNPGKTPSVSSRRTSDSPRAVALTRTRSSTSTSSIEEKRSIASDYPKVSLTRTKSSASTSSIEERRRSSIILPKRETKPRIPSSLSTVDVLKKNITPKKESSPINRSAVTQRKREMEVVNHMLSGVASSGKNRLTQKRSTTVNEAEKKKSTKATRSIVDNKASTSAQKTRTPLIRPLPSNKP
ncbi:kinesin, putative [Rhizophagus clarus]|uniref:Kinesin, putative n=1 Tax=Rhizophagus clarus TaxID=94130 RepID=A0A8H3M994_9GLOM|nr:kinesin, putative [Rhizophagus clarus]